MSDRKTVLDNRKALPLVTLFNVIEAVWSGFSIRNGAGHRVEPVTALFSLLLFLAFASIAFRSSFWADRFVFGSMALISLVIAAGSLPLSPATLLALAVVKSFLWLMAALVGISLLLRSAPASPDLK